MRIAVTGARGFVGSHLVEYLAARGDEVVPIVVRAPCDRRAIAAAFRRTDAVVHLAGVISATRDESSKPSGTYRSTHTRCSSVAYFCL